MPLAYRCIMSYVQCMPAPTEQHLIFDFDGTIADSFDIFVDALESVMQRPKRLSSKEIADLRGRPTREIIAYLGIKKWQIPRLAVKGRRAVAERMGEVGLFADMPAVILDLQHLGYHLYIVSTNEEEVIRNVLKRNGLEEAFEAIYASASLFGKAKKLKSLQKKRGIPATQCVYIGDESRDIEAARQVGMRSIAVEWGYATPAALASHHPDVQVSKPKDLIGALGAL